MMKRLIPVIILAAALLPVHATDDHFYYDDTRVSLTHLDNGITVTLDTHNMPCIKKLCGFNVTIVNKSDERIDFDPQRDVEITMAHLDYTMNNIKRKTTVYAADDDEAAAKYAKRGSRSARWAAIATAIGGIGMDYNSSAGQLNAMRVDNYAQTAAGQRTAIDSSQVNEHFGRTTVFPNNTLNTTISYWRGSERQRAMVVKIILNDRMVRFTRQDWTDEPFEAIDKELNPVDTNRN